MSSDRGTLEASVGLAAPKGIVTGLASAIEVLVLLLSGEVVAGSVCLLSAATSFGLLPDRVLRT